MTGTKFDPLTRSQPCTCSSHHAGRCPECCSSTAQNSAQSRDSDVCACQEVFTLHSASAQLLLCFLSPRSKQEQLSSFPGSRGTQGTLGSKELTASPEQHRWLSQTAPHLNHIIRVCKTWYQALHVRAQIQRPRRTNTVSCNFSNFCLKTGSRKFQVSLLTMPEVGHTTLNWPSSGPCFFVPPFCWPWSPFCTMPVASTLMRMLAYRVSKEAQKHHQGRGKQQREEPSHSTKCFCFL